MGYAFNFRDVWAQRDFLSEGIRVTLLLSTATILTGLLIGAIGAAMRVYGGAVLRAVSVTYVEVIRNTPLIVQLFLTFLACPASAFVSMRCPQASSPCH
jgi:His/Glu/Gln/Arg/opine family amino acid ABC transporter permease subunit